jgi:hypothetical protein
VGGQGATAGGGAGGLGQGGRGVGGTAAGGGRGGAGGGPQVCNANNCAMGCCAGTVCVPMPTAKQCGRGGFQCAPCAGCQRCSTAGACQLDPASTWQVQAVSATLDDTTSSGGAWDRRNEPFGGSLPDPFVQLDVQVDQPSVRSLGWTTTLVDTVTPIWNELLHPQNMPIKASDLLPGGQAWQIWVGDEDDNQLGQVMCELDGPLAASDFAAGGFTRTNLDACQSVKIALICVP